MRQEEAEFAVRTVDPENAEQVSQEIGMVLALPDRAIRRVDLAIQMNDRNVSRRNKMLRTGRLTPKEQQEALISKKVSSIAAQRDDTYELRLLDAFPMIKALEQLTEEDGYNTNELFLLFARELMQRDINSAAAVDLYIADRNNEELPETFAEAQAKHVGKYKGIMRESIEYLLQGTTMHRQVMVEVFKREQTKIKISKSKRNALEYVQKQLDTT